MTHPIDELAGQIRAFYLSLTTDWLTLPQKSMTRAERVGSYLCCAAGMVECSFDGKAWTDDSSVDFSATACGLWIDFNRNSILPATIRDAVPAWKDRPVTAQMGDQLLVRLTTFGVENLESVRRNPLAEALLGALASLRADLTFVEFLGKHPIRGKVNVRILASHATAPGVAPKQDTLEVVLEIREAQKQMQETLSSMLQAQSKVVGLGFLRMEEIRAAYPALTDAQLDTIRKKLESWRERHEDEVMMTEPDPVSLRRRYAYPGDVVARLVHALS